jgi:hypothetical protein
MRKKQSGYYINDGQRWNSRLVRTFVVDDRLKYG